MIVEEFDIGKQFIDNNELIFECELPFPTIKTIHSYEDLGTCTCIFDNDNNITSVTIAISDKYNFTKTQFNDVLLHEMIHYYLAWTKKDVNLSHGREFKKMMKEINQKFGTNIDIVTNASKLERINQKSSFLDKLFSLF